MPRQRGARPALWCRRPHRRGVAREAAQPRTKACVEGTRCRRSCRAGTSQLRQGPPLELRLRRTLESHGVAATPTPIATTLGGVWNSRRAVGQGSEPLRRTSGHEAQRRCARTSHRVAQTRRTGCHGLRSRRRSELNGRAKRTDCGFSSGATTAARILRVGGTMSDLRRRLERKKKPKAETISAVHTVPLPATRAFRPALAVEAQDAWNNRQDAASVHPPSGFAPVTRPVGR